MTNPNPSDLSHGTIQNLFYNQIRNLSAKTANERMKTFDMQFSDLWL